MRLAPRLRMMEAGLEGRIAVRASPPLLSGSVFLNILRFLVVGGYIIPDGVADRDSVRDDEAIGGKLFLER